jgi:hypothetical protein
MRIEIAKLAGRLSPLAGAALGRNVFGKLAAKCALPEQPTICILDFSGVELATASFLRESVVAFRDYTRNAKSKLYPVIANASDDTIDDLYALLADRTDAMVACSLDGGGRLVSWRIIGRLDQKQRETLDLVQEIEESGKVADTALLSELRPDEGVQTLWNNRLAALVSKGLLLEFVDGRAKRFRTVSAAMDG